jgi:hypothetical protein
MTTTQRLGPGSYEFLDSDGERLAVIERMTMGTWSAYDRSGRCVAWEYTLRDVKRALAKHFAEVKG